MPRIIAAMTWIVALVAVTLGLGGGWIAYSANRRRAERERRREHRAIPATARVLAHHGGALPRARDVVPLRLRLLLEAPNAANDREIEVDWEVPPDRLDDVAVGKRIRVRIDRFDPERVYPGIAGAERWAGDTTTTSH